MRRIVAVLIFVVGAAAAVVVAAVAAGADGLLIEVHPNPCDAWCDADQALTPGEFGTLMGTLRAVAGAVGRDL